VNGDMLVDRDPHTGSTLRTMHLPGYFDLPLATLTGVPGGLSQNGRWLVLESFDNAASIPSATHLLVVETSFGKPIQQIDLSGYFQFDAISNDGQRIFLIQYVSSTEYYVRQFDVGIKQLNPTVIFDKADGGAAMAGLRISGVPSSDGQWLYSLYVRQDKSPFIHALSLNGDLLALCVDLPGSGSASDSNAFDWSLALSADGSHLYAANGASGTVADISLSSGFPSPPRTAKLDSSPMGGILGVQNVEAKEMGGSAAAVSPDGKTLVMAGSTGVVWVDTNTLKAHDTALQGWHVWSLAISPDGTTLYAVSDGGMIAELPMTGSHQATTFSGAAGQPLALIRVAAS
jgi:WD40 repeat protein